MGDVFVDFWGRGFRSKTTSEGRALIVHKIIDPTKFPTAGPLNLIPGKDAWLSIATLLAEGHTVTDAVAQANQLMETKHYTGVVWTALGDPDNARIAPARRIKINVAVATFSAFFAFFDVPPGATQEAMHCPNPIYEAQKFVQTLYPETNGKISIHAWAIKSARFFN